MKMLFTGDILCEMGQNRACATPGGYCYAPMFERIAPALWDCDYLVGNLETPVAGAEMGYSDRPYSFNTPEPFLDALANCGFDLLSTANNHCMDRGLEGLIATCDNLDRSGIAHIGTYPGAHFRDAPFVLELGGMRFGFLAYTYGTNAFFHHTYLPEGADWAVNLLQPEEQTEGAIDLLDAAGVESRVAELYGAPNDVYMRRIRPLWARLEGDISRLRDSGAEYLIMLLHCGGQHALRPDAYTRWVIRRLRELGVDLVVCNHQHILHPYAREGDFRAAYCLGNFADTPDANPNGRGIGEEYSALLSLDFERGNRGVNVRGARFSMIRNVLDENGVSVIWPLYDLIESEADPARREEYLYYNRRFVNLLRGTPADMPVIPAPDYALETQ